jgi:formate/nitrite transporter
MEVMTMPDGAAPTPVTHTEAPGSPGAAGLSLDALLPADVARKAEDVGVAKAGMPLDRLLALSVLAGAFIALGGVFSTVATAGGGMPPGVARVLGGVVFSLGLVLVVGAGAELFTGNTLIVMAVASRKVSVAALVRNWAVVYVGNLVGAMSTALLVVWSGTFGRGDGTIGVRALEVAAAKTSLGAREAVVLGVLANGLVCLAVWLSFAARTLTDKVLAVVFPITAFVAAGFEHSVANMFFVPAGLLVKATASTGFWSTTGLSAADFPTVTWSDFVIGNLLPVTVGNVLGGALLVGLAYWFVYLRPSPAPPPGSHASTTTGPR